MPVVGTLSFFFPMWNEEALIDRTVAAAHECGRDLVTENEIGAYEIVIVDDASTDATGKLADEMAATDDRVRVVHHDTNRGLGAAIRTGFAESRGDVVLYTDADMPFDLGEMGKALRLLRVYDADIVSAYRFDRTGEGPRRLLYSHAYNLLMRTVLGLRVRDVNFAFKLVRAEVLEHITLHSEGSFIDVELLAKAERLGFHVIQFGVDYFPRTRGESTLSSPAVIKTILQELARLGPELRRMERVPGRERWRRRR